MKKRNKKTQQPQPQESLLPRLVVQECALAYLQQRLDEQELRLAESEAHIRLKVTGQVVAIVKAELERGYDDAATEALYRVLAQLEDKEEST